jgi:hypothetical protein
MLQPEMNDLPRPAEGEDCTPEDLALGALLALRERWNEACREQRVITLQALGFEVEPQQRYLSAVCSSHGRFHRLWHAAATDDRPERIDCPGDWRTVCPQVCAVDFAYEPARPPD